MGWTPAWRPALVALLLLGLALMGCRSSGSGSEPGLDASGSPPTGLVYERLQSCGLLTDGYISDRVDIFYVPTLCYDRCLASATCEQLQATLCDETIDVLVECDEQCAFECGGGELVAVERVCDGTLDCGDGSDESGCSTFTCDDGKGLPQSARCDGLEQCRDGSDEEGCGSFECGDGTEVAASLVCDGYDHCTDASDEEDCPMFRCDDGELIDPARRCDGVAQCADDSDESDCAQLDYMCEPRS